MPNQEDHFSIVSDFRMEKLLEEVEAELNKIQPEIEYLESMVEKLNDLKLKKSKLLSLKTSLKVVHKQNNINNLNISFDKNNLSKNESLELNSGITNKNITEKMNTSQHNLFIPDLALNEVGKFLRTKNNLNYEIFKSVIYNGGQASTDEIKDYLVKNRIKQPKTGKYFDDVELKDISSRANYLVRKKLLISSGPGLFQSTLGYSE